MELLFVIVACVIMLFTALDTDGNGVLSVDELIGHFFRITPMLSGIDDAKREVRAHHPSLAKKLM